MRFFPPGNAQNDHEWWLCAGGSGRIAFVNSIPTYPCLQTIVSRGRTWDVCHCRLAIRIGTGGACRRLYAPIVRAA
jgi:hypothetical protein